MTQGQVRLPADSTGKRLNMRERTIGGNLYQEQVVLPLASDRIIEGTYILDLSAGVLLAAAHAANVGFWYLWLPALANNDIAIRRIRFESQHGTLLATPTSPRVALRRFTATGTTLTGTLITPAKLDTVSPTSDLVASAAATGLTITEVTDNILTFMPTVALTAVGAAGVDARLLDFPPEMPLILHVGQGLLIKQIDAGTASDTRRIGVQVIFEQFTEPADVV